MDVLDPAFPRQVRAARALLGMNQEEFAEMLGVSKPFIARLERGSRLGQASKLREVREHLQALGFEFGGTPYNRTIWVAVYGEKAVNIRESEG